MRQRLISGAVLVAVVVVVFLLGAPGLTLGIAALAALAAYEAVVLVRKAGFPSSMWLPVVTAPSAALALAFFSEPTFELHFALVAPGIAIVLILAAVLAFRN